MNWSRFIVLILTTGVAWAGSAVPPPSPESAFPELKVYDSAGRPWRAAQEDWAGARRRVAQDPAWVDWLQQERQAVDRWMDRHHDHVEWRCGFWHGFVSPKDGSYLIWTDEVPGQDVATLHSASDPHVDLTPEIFGGWVYLFRRNHADMMQRAARLYLLTGDEHFAAWAAAQLDYYADHYLDWAENRGGARLYGQTLDVATNLIPYAATVRLLGPGVTPERRARWYRQFFRPQVEVLNRTSQNIQNIAVWHRAAVMQVALVFNDAALWRDALEGEFGLRQQIARGITGDYLWWEQSFGYNNYVMRALLTLFTTAGIYGRADELAAEMNVAENLMLAPVYLRFPDGHAPNPADNTGAPLVVPDPSILTATYRVFPTTIGLQQAALTRNWDTLLDPPPPARPLTGLPVVVSRNLEASRMGLLCAGGWQVFFHYGQLTGAHAQAEALNFSAFYGVDDITHDPGTVGYFSPLHRGYYTRGLNHNVPLIDGEGEEPPQAGELISFSALPPRISVRQPRYRPDGAASRVLEIVDRSLVDTATIEAIGGPRRLGLALHLQGTAQLPAAFVPDDDFAATRPPAFRYWRDVRRASFDRHGEILIAFAKVTMRLQFEAPGAFTLWHGFSPDIPPRRRESFYLELDRPATSATIVTRFVPQP